MTLTWTKDTGVQSPLRDRLRVLLFARVLIMSVFLAGAGALWFAKPDVTRALLGDVTFSVLALAYLGTVLSAALVRTVARPGWLAYLQIVFDVLLITGALGAMRGADGPMALLYVLPIANAAGLLMVPGAVAAAVEASRTRPTPTNHSTLIFRPQGICTPHILIPKMFGTRGAGSSKKRSINSINCVWTPWPPDLQTRLLPLLLPLPGCLP